MLQKIGDSLKGKKTLAYVILVPLVLVFAVWGAAGIVNMDFFGAANWAAKVNGQALPLQRVNDAWREQQSQWQQRFGTELPESERKLLQDGLLEDFVRQTLVEERTQSAGYRVPAAKVDEFIRSYPAFQVDGKYNENLARARLAQIGVTADAFRADVRSSLRNEELQRALTLSDFRTPLEVERALRIEDEQREVRYAVLPVEKFAATAQVDDAAIKAYYEQNPSRFQTQETVRLQYAELRLDQVAATVQVDNCGGSVGLKVGGEVGEVAQAIEAERVGASEGGGAQFGDRRVERDEALPLPWHRLDPEQSGEDHGVRAGVGDDQHATVGGR